MSSGFAFSTAPGCPNESKIGSPLGPVIVGPCMIPVKENAAPTTTKVTTIPITSFLDGIV
jgi:hypothetical protein